MKNGVYIDAVFRVIDDIAIEWDVELGHTLVH